jgi:hypothetical protein
MRKTIVYILSTNYAGSHFLSLLLGSHSRAMHLGEVHWLAKPRLTGGCHLCGPKEFCPVFREIHPHNVDHMYDLLFSPNAEIQALVDASKRLYWVERFLNNADYSKKYIHLIRDPRALVRRWMLTPLPGSRKRRWTERWKVMRFFPWYTHFLLFAKQTDFLAYRWLAENQALTRFTQRNRLDATLVTYEDLAKKTPREVKRLVEWIGLDYEPAQLEYWNFKHHGTQKEDYEWVKDKKTSYFDTRWKTFLTQETASRIRNNRHVGAYLRSLGLAMTDDGLTRAT